MSDPVLQWGLYQWFGESGVDLVHPDDLEAFCRFLPNGKVFHCVGRYGEYLVMAYDDLRFRVKPSLFKPVPTPARQFGGTVGVKSKGEYFLGVIGDVIWHFQKAEPYYHVFVDGKKLKKQYWQTDFETS